MVYLECIIDHQQLSNVIIACIIILCISETGNRTYVGYVYTEITVNNAVARVFVKIMQDVIDRKETSGALYSQCKSTSDYSSDACDDGEMMIHNTHCTVTVIFLIV